MANTPITSMPVATAIDGSELVPIVQPGDASTGVSKRATASQIGNTANIGAISVGISGLTQLSAANAATDFMAILHSDGIVYKVTPNGLNLAAGNMPTGGTVSQFLIKNSSTNYDTVWATMTGDVVMSGTASFTATIVTAAVSYAKIQEVGARSVVGVAGNATAVVDAIQGTTNQVLVVNPGGTGIVFSQVNLAAAAAVTGILTVPFGGTGTSALTANGVILGNGASAVNVATAGSAGQIFVGQATLPSFQTMTGDLTLNSAGSAVIAAAAVTYAKFQSVAALSVVGNSSSATTVAAAITGTANQVLVVNSAGTGLAFGVATAASIGTGAVTYSRIQNVAALSVFGNGSSASTVGADITGTANQVLVVNSAGTGLAFGVATAASIGTAAVTYSRIQNVAGLSVFGNASTASTVGADLTGTTDQVLVVSSAGTGVGFGRVNLSVTASVTGALTIVQPATILATTAIPAGGTTGNGYKMSSVSNFGIFFGSGAPSLLAGTGSIYLRTDGSTTTSRLYVNTNGSATWVAFQSTS